VVGGGGSRREADRAERGRGGEPDPRVPHS
jgi:hypothetical protein